MLGSVTFEDTQKNEWNNLKLMQLEFSEQEDDKRWRFDYNRKKIKTRNGQEGPRGLGDWLGIDADFPPGFEAARTVVLLTKIRKGYKWKQYIGRN